MNSQITAVNYVAQAEYGLKSFLSNQLRGYKNDIHAFSDVMLSTIADSVHFSIPDNGKIFDDNLKGLEGNALRLPFPKIVAQYFCGDLPTGSNAFEVEPCTKRVVFAEEVHKDYMISRGMDAVMVDISDYWIHVSTIGFYPKQKMWIPLPAGAFTPSAWEANLAEDYESLAVDGVTRKPKDGEKSLTIIPNIISETMCKVQENKYGEEEAMRRMLFDLSPEIQVIYELCEALSCSNVTHELVEPVNQSMNAKRIRRGKLPIYETRTLVLKAPNIVRGRTESNPSGRASPRQHLRRGHIRRLESGNIWVNSAVIGNKEIGVIEKTYAVMK